MTKSTTLRRNMAVAQLFPNWVHDQKILEAMYDIPREEFVPEQYKDSAYADEDLALASGRGLLAPLTLARLLELAQIWDEERVLVVGALSGYAAAVASELSNNVTAIDTDQALIDEARANFERLGVGHVDMRLAKSLAEGCDKNAPYDVIILCGAYETIPESIASQLKIGGRLVAVRKVSDRPGKQGGLGKGMLAKRTEQGLQPRDYFDTASAVLPGFEAKGGFEF